MKGLTLPSAAWKPTQSLRPPDSSLSETLGELSSPFFLRQQTTSAHHSLENPMTFVNYFDWTYPRNKITFIDRGNAL